jgi:hypothetical protein
LEYEALAFLETALPKYINETAFAGTLDHISISLCLKIQELSKNGTDFSAWKGLMSVLLIITLIYPNEMFFLVAKSGVMDQILNNLKTNNTDLKQSMLIALIYLSKS